MKGHWMPLLAIIILTRGLFPESATSRVTVRIKALDKLSVSDGGLVILTGQAGQDRIGPANTDAARLSFTHNRPATKKITAEIKPAHAPAAQGNDLLVKILVEDGTGAKVLYNDSGTTGPQDVLTGIGPGAIADKKVTYIAECTASGTTISSDTDFSFTVTFTGVDE